MQCIRDPSRLLQVSTVCSFLLRSRAPFTDVPRFGSRLRPPAEGHLRFWNKPHLAIVYCCCDVVCIYLLPLWMISASLLMESVAVFSSITYLFWWQHAAAWCGISVPRPGVDLGLRPSRHQTLTTRPPGAPQFSLLCAGFSLGISATHDIP